MSPRTPLPGAASVSASSPLTVAELAARITALPGVAEQVVDEASGLPESVLGSRFYFVGSGRTLPFATIVLRDVPGFDEESHLDRDGVWRLNVQLGRDRFETQFGYPPRRLADHRSAVDFAAADRVVPHPAYGAQGWCAVVCPSRRSLPQLMELLTHAAAKAAERAARHEDR